jgi:hypothetical protein
VLRVIAMLAVVLFRHFVLVSGQPADVTNVVGPVLLSHQETWEPAFGYSGRPAWTGSSERRGGPFGWTNWDIT